MGFFSENRSQLSAIANLRWRLFANSVRTKRGKLELISRILVACGFSVGALGGALGMAVGAYFFIADGKAEMLPLLFWPVFLFWQIFPIAATAFTNNPDSSDLLRFPLTYRSYFLIRIAYGLFDPAAVLGSCWLIGALIGITLARPLLLPWALLVVVAFAAFNLLLTQMIFAWIERWLAQRRTREILGVFFILIMLSFQLIGPMMEHFNGRSHPDADRIVKILVPIQRALPPGLAADAIAQMAVNAPLAAFQSLFFLCAFAAAVASLLHIRLRAQFHGENLSEVTAQRTARKFEAPYAGWKLPGLPAPVAAVLEKEVRYLARSGPMLLTLIMPIIMLVIFRLGPMSHLRRTGPFMAKSPGMAFPGAAAYALLVLTNLIYNTFGGDGGGVQFFYASPVSFRQIVMAKNITHATILAFNFVLAWWAVAYLYGAPPLDLTIATLAGLIFAAPLNFTVGNLLSIYAPKKRDFATFGRQNASQTTVFASLGVQVVIVGVGIGAFLLARSYENYWIATALFLALSVVTISLYWLTLGRIDRIALDKRETLIAELCRA